LCVILSFEILLLVLFGAALHAGWNAMVKSGTDKMLDSSLVAAGCAVCALPFLPFFPLPGTQAIGFLIASAALQFTYYRLVGAAYQAGDIGLVYPIMRGLAPLLVAASSTLILGESLSPIALIGTVILCTGILTLALEGRRGGAKAILLASANAVVIAAYTFVDGIGARTSTDAISYTLWMTFLPPIMLFAWAFYERAPSVVIAHIKRNWWRGILGGACSLLSYGIALWAMTKAPVAMVAALRETSILFAILISVFILKEVSSKWRYLAASLIALGVLVMRLG
jgi:drug/metabolite transporter (DMT)-like permease